MSTGTKSSRDIAYIIDTRSGTPRVVGQDEGIWERFQWSLQTRYGTDIVQHPDNFSGRNLGTSGALRISPNNNVFIYGAEGFVGFGGYASTLEQFLNESESRMAGLR